MGEELVAVVGKVMIVARERILLHVLQSKERCLSVGGTLAQMLEDEAPV